MELFSCNASIPETTSTFQKTAHYYYFYYAPSLAMLHPTHKHTHRHKSTLFTNHTPKQVKSRCISHDSATRAVPCIFPSHSITRSLSLSFYNRFLSPTDSRSLSICCTDSGSKPRAKAHFILIRCRDRSVPRVFLRRRRFFLVRNFSWPILFRRNLARLLIGGRVSFVVFVRLLLCVTR